jgi:hypothetical protein
MARKNALEEDVQFAAEVYVELVEELLKEVAPEGPWWTKDLSTAEALWRWMEVREPIMTWLTAAAPYMGFDSYDKMMDNLEDFWMSPSLVDLVPPEIIDAIPVELAELVQANAYDAADHIRKMEKAFHKHALISGLWEQNRPQIPPPLPEAQLPPVTGTLPPEPPPS